MKQQLGFFNIVDYKDLKNKRIYDDEKHSVADFIFVEFIALLIESIEKDYNVFHIKTNAIYDINIPKKDMDFITLDFFGIKDKNVNFYSNIHKYFEDFKKLNKEYQYSENTILLKKQIANDIYKIFMLGYVSKEVLNPQNNIGALFSIPFLVNEKITYEFIVVSKKTFNIDIFFNLNFETFEIHSVNPLLEQDFKYSFFERLFNIKNFHFFNNYFPYNSPIDIIDDSIPELISLNNKLKSFFEETKQLDDGNQIFKINTRNIANYNDSDKLLAIQNSLNELFHEIRSIKIKLLDIDVVIKTYLSVICFHFYIFDKNLFEDWNFFISFEDLINQDPLNSDDFLNVHNYLQLCNFYILLSIYHNNLFILDCCWFSYKNNILFLKK